MQSSATTKRLNIIHEKISTKEYLAYFSYGFGQCFSFGLVGTFILFFYTDILGISAVAASIIFLVARIWDAVIDPVVAGFMDTRRTKHGKFRGYMKFTPILIVVSSIFCFFSPDISVTGKIIYAGATYILWGTIYAFSDIPFWSLSTVISKKGEDRTKLLTVANLGVYGGIGMVGFLVPILLATFNKNYTPSVSYLITVGIIMVAAYILMLIGYKYTKERVVPEHNEKVTFKDVIESAKVNKYMFRILLVFFLNVFMNIVQGIILYFFTYNLNAPQLMSVFGIIGTLSAVGFLFIPLLTKYFKKRNILRTLLGMDIILRIIFFLVGYESIGLVITFLAITQLLYSATGPIISAMLSETVEYSEVKTGKRTEAIVFGGQTFAGKLSVALAGAFIGLLLTLIGYQANVEQTEFTLTGLFIVVSILPALGSLLRLLVLSKYDYTEVEFNECIRIIQERKSTEA